ncbi:bifunctional hydroxymethylpyrimidine kinase/phosphomethylpyrimidine kinase [Methylocystis heyeri]|uniref:hydroxymethylpyrimidine kinase n=1 Tax=Methylocystis heyeri TaxID=391905 RepID=A0A6B8KHD6_9HYPH|nr:bifunctional hydroxymethylpyrimidine kinase/phosphomethylpyrimidine kinase [Methylocystis heyeri]QGM45913.1 bifunctional hydroxymethylpyrimidine kinase/phosphomethylpyrimidine kinase [Methylocystis heyeri]
MVRPAAKLLAIAGSDPSGGAGAQADIKTFSALGGYGMAAITALTAQNTQGVLASVPVAPQLVAAQIDAIFADIEVDAVKIGMLAQADVAHAVAEALARGKAKNIVLDPVLAPSQGEDFSSGDLAPAIVEILLPMAALVTPNLAEAAALTATPAARSVTEMERQARALVSLGAGAALVKGGHLDGAPVDVLFAAGQSMLFGGARVETGQTHGTGCALSSAIAAGLGQGLALEQAVARAKTWLEHALIAGEAFRLGHGAGPPDFFWETRGEPAEGR